MCSYLLFCVNERYLSKMFGFYTKEFIYSQLYLCIFFLKALFLCLRTFLSFDDFQIRPVFTCSQQKVILSCDYEHPMFSFLCRHKNKVIIVLITLCNMAYKESLKLILDLICKYKACISGIRHQRLLRFTCKKHYRVTNSLLVSGLRRACS